MVLTARNLDRLEDTARWCGSGTEVVPADLGDPAAVDGFAGSVVRYLAGRPLAGIVHGAGLMAWDSPEAGGGWSLVPAVNALASWRLTQALEPPLLGAPGARVLLVAGAPATFRGIGPDVSQWKGDQKGRGLRLALEAAAAKVLIAREFHRRWAGRASVFAFHPGFVKSRLADGLPFPLNVLGCAAQPFLASRCATGEFLALDPGAPALSGTLVSGRRSYPDFPVPGNLEAFP